MPIPKKLPSMQLHSLIARISDVKETDSPIQASRKVIETMRLAGFPQKDIARAERLIRDAQARGVK